MVKSSRSSFFGEKKSLLGHCQSLTVIIPEMMFAQASLLVTLRLSLPDQPKTTNLVASTPAEQRRGPTLRGGREKQALRGHSRQRLSGL